nr:MAG TPA: hypothetical protein [Bacteriophage sp.]
MIRVRNRWRLWGCEFPRLPQLNHIANYYTLLNQDLNIPP